MALPQKAMNRQDFLKTIVSLPLAGAAMNLRDLQAMTADFERSEKMPILFVGHGNPMNAIEDNVFSQGWRELGKSLPKPTAILCISAHWETKGTYVTAMAMPKTIHDFGGFPQELSDTQYPAPGSSWLAEETKKAVKKTTVGMDNNWGLDHGCWSILKPMFPNADIPVIQFSLDYTQPAQYHYDLAKELSSLRSKGVLIIGSGNMVHNLRRIALKNNDFNAPFAHPWAEEANNLFKKLINENRHSELIRYDKLGSAVQLAIPTPEHFLPLLYILALKEKNEQISYFNDITVGGSASMTSLKIR